MKKKYLISITAATAVVLCAVLLGFFMLRPHKLLASTKAAVSEYDITVFKGDYTVNGEDIAELLNSTDFSPDFVKKYSRLAKKDEVVLTETECCELIFTGKNKEETMAAWKEGRQNIWTFSSDNGTLSVYGEDLTAANGNDNFIIL